MKKIIFSAVAALAFIVTLSIGIGCKKDNPISCAEKASKVSAKLVAYRANDSNENCKAFKVALEEYKNSCSSSMSDEEKAQFDAAVADMNCP